MKKKIFLPTAAAAILVLALCWYFTGNGSGRMKTAGKSPYQGAPLEQYSAQTAGDQYAAGASEIEVSVQNGGETSHELYHPILEWQQEGMWYSLRIIDEEENVTGNLLGVVSGETKQFSLFTKSYGKLLPGRYRAVFPVWGSRDYIAAEFDLV